MMLPLFTFLCLIALVLANTEKTIFLGPEPVSIPLTHPTLSDLRLDTLTPTNGSLRTQLSAQFPSPAHPEGTATWLILDNLTPSQRYEVRVCWAATQPTAFTLTTFPLSTVWDTPDLMASLHAYSTTRQHHHHQQQQPTTPEHNNNNSNSNSSSDSERQSSILLLRIHAAADYFTTDASLMRKVPPVDVDIILDPSLYNVLPRSLAGTACYIVVVAVAAWFVARRVASGLTGLVAGGPGSSDKKTQ